MMCALKIIPRDENGKQYSCADIYGNRAFYYNQIFNIDNINGLLKANKQFHYSIVSDGVSASIFYEVTNREIQELANDNLIQQQYMNDEFTYVLGIDPGMKTWLAAVRRHVVSNKEVRIDLN